MSTARVKVAIHAALDPRAAGGVQTNVTSLVHGLKACTDRLKASLLATPPVLEAWRARAEPELSVAPWQYVFPWYRAPVSGAEGDVSALIEKLASSPTDIAERDGVVARTGAEVLHFPHQVAFDSDLPTLYEPWDLQHIQLPELFSAGEREWRTALYKRACERAALVITATAATKRDLVEALDIDPAKIVVIYRDSKPMPSGQGPQADARVLAKLGVEPPFAFYPAQTYAHKNHAWLMRTLGVARERGVRINLVCSGKRHDAAWPAIAEAIDKARIGEQVRFVGAVSDEDLACLYRTCRFVAFPSLFEGLGLPLLEAMQLGAPIAAARASCIPETVGDAGLLFDPSDCGDGADHLARLWEDHALRDKLISRGRMRRQAFSWDRAALPFANAYARVAGRNTEVEQTGVGTL